MNCIHDAETAKGEKRVGRTDDLIESSGRGDSNPRPLGPEPSALARLRHAPR
jgi:hypothetical protein